MLEFRERVLITLNLFRNEKSFVGPRRTRDLFSGRCLLLGASRERR